VAAIFLNLDTRERWIVSFLYRPGKSAGTHQIGVLVGPDSWSLFPAGRYLSSPKTSWPALELIQCFIHLVYQFKIWGFKYSRNNHMDIGRLLHLYICLDVQWSIFLKRTVCGVYKISLKVILKYREQQNTFQLERKVKNFSNSVIFVIFPQYRIQCRYDCEVHEISINYTPNFPIGCTTIWISMEICHFCVREIVRCDLPILIVVSTIW
jgi:hypothetical protein